MKKVYLFILFTFLSTCNLYAQISVPDYSFTGKEITGFKVQPSYTSVNFNFKLPSKMDVYIQEIKSEFTVSDKQDYSAKEPSMIYSNQVGTSLSSIFVGAKAYRNNIVKMFLQDKFIDVVASYEKYKEKLENTDFFNETTLLYGLSLYKTGSHIQSYNVLKSLAVSDNPYTEIAQDTLFHKLYELNKTDLLEELANEVKSYSAFSLAIWLRYLNDNNKYEEIIKHLDNNADFEKTYPEFINLRVSSLYFLNNYQLVASFEPMMKDKPTYYLTIDSMIMIGKVDEAIKILSSLEDSEIKKILLTKADIAKNDFKSASDKLKFINNDKELLALLFYTVTNKFDKITPDFLLNFHFKSKQNNDYINFYRGLKYLSDKKYVDALKSFSLVIFNKSMVVDSYFYQGMASIYIDTSRAAWNYRKYIDNGTDSEKIMLSKFMLAQINYLNNNLDDALMLIDDCNQEYCYRLKGDIYIAKGMDKEALDVTGNLKDDRARLIKANAYYNSSEYSKALGELVKIKNKSPDSEYLLMMSLFKNKRYDDAIKILEKNKKDPRIFGAGIDQLILAGYTKKALAYIDTMKDLPPDYQVERAKLLQAEKKYKEAEKVYNNLLKNNEKIYESMSGLFQISQINGNTKDFIAKSADFIEKSKDFENKDLLLSQFATYAMDLKEPNLAIRYVNYFIDNYKKSPYLSDVYMTRARLFKFTQRYENCVSDADSIISLGKDNGEAMFIKAECLEYINKNKAVEIYKTMAVDNGRFNQPALGRLIILSDNPDEILSSAIKMKDISPDIYKKGIIRFLEIIDTPSFETHKQSIFELTHSGYSDISSVALWRIGMYYAEKKDYEKSAQSFLKGYYLFPKEEYAVKNLKGARWTYETRKMKLQKDNINKLLDTYNIKNSESKDKKENSSKSINKENNKKSINKDKKSKDNNKKAVKKDNKK